MKRARFTEEQIIAVLREHEAGVKTAGLSERRACSIVSADRKMVRYRSCRPPDLALRAQLRDLANERRRFGYCRLFVLLRRDGEPSGINRICRLYREEGLTVRKRRTRRRAVGTRAPILVEAKANARWSLELVASRPHSAASMIRLPAARASASSTWSTTSLGNALPPFPTPRSRGVAWRAN
jgi:transposase InsO family protein